MAGITDYTAALQAANTAYINMAQVDVLPGIWSELSADRGPAMAELMAAGYVDDLSEFRTMTEGQQRTFDGGRAYEASYTMSTVYKGYELGRKKVEYDPSGRTASALTQQAAEAALMMWEDTMMKVVAANTLVGPDGVTLISSAHPNGPSGTQSNSAGAALSHSTFRTGVAAMQNLRRENGTYIRANPTHLMVNPAEEDLALEIVGADKPIYFDAAGAEATSSVVGGVVQGNVFQGRCKVFVTPYITAGDWAMFDLSRSAKPWQHSIGRAPTPHVPDANSPSVWDRDVFQYYTDGDFIHGPGHWQMAYGYFA